MKSKKYEVNVGGEGRMERFFTGASNIIITVLSTQTKFEARISHFE